MFYNLQKNIYHFVAAKNYQQLKDITLALFDGNELRNENDFFMKVKELNIKYNETYLRTERNTAIAGGQMSAQWVEFEKDADILPLLQYSTVGDANVRQEHEVLNGVIKPINDSFWNTFYPPNGWNCRCGVRQVTDNSAEPTPDEKINRPGINEMFKTNLAKAGLIFPEDHAYYKGIPPAELTKALVYLPPENSFFTHIVENGDAVRFHVLHNENKISENLDMAHDLANIGFKEITFLPDLNEKDRRIREKFLPSGYKQPDPRRNPDAVIKDKQGRTMVCGFSNLTGAANIENSIKQAEKQAEFAIIKLNFDKTPPYHSLDAIVDKRLIKTETLKGVIILAKDGQIIIERYK